jgi:hypothetical protein
LLYRNIGALRRLCFPFYDGKCCGISILILNSFLGNAIIIVSAAFCAFIFRCRCEVRRRPLTGWPPAALSSRNAPESAHSFGYAACSPLRPGLVASCAVLAECARIRAFLRICSVLAPASWAGRQLRWLLAPASWVCTLTESG